jgi:hypothetical protein
MDPYQELQAQDNQLEQVRSKLGNFYYQDGFKQKDFLQI